MAARATAPPAASDRSSDDEGTTLQAAAGKPGRRLFLIDGPSLVYRAFYALPESIATSTGVPTNAIFGFASMLVKIVTEHGVCPTVVAWDAGTSGRSELFPEYKAQRRSRPDLLKAQWPAMEPLVEAFGYRNVKIEGYEADDVIASLAERARRADPPVPVMIVTGDRDVFQLIDEQGLVQVMATARGITETKVYDRRAVLDRYGIPPELIPDFYGLKGDTSDNIPGIPGIGDKTASELIQRYGTLERVLDHVPEIGGAKRKQNLLEHAQDARVSKRLATVDRDVQVDFDPAVEAAREPDRSRLREVFREYELRDPLRRLEEALEERELAAPVSASELVLAGRMRAGAVADIPGFIAGRPSPPSPLCVVVRAAETPEGALFGDDAGWRFAVALGEEVLCGDCELPAEVVEACGEHAVMAHDAKALGLVPPGLVHDTLLGAYLLEPARRGYPFAELCEERGLAASVEDPAARDALLLGALASWQREQIAQRGLEGVMRDIELPLVRVLREMELIGVRLNVPRLQEVAERVREEIAELEQEIFALADEEFLIASPQQLGEILFEKLGLLAQAARQDRLLDRRASAAGDPLRARDRPPDRALARAVDADQDLFRRAPRPGRRALPRPHDVPAGRRPDGAPVEHQPEHAERPDPHHPRPRDPRLFRGRGGPAADLRGLLADRAARARPRGAGARAEGDLPTWRRRPHRDRLAGLRGRRRGA